MPAGRFLPAVTMDLSEKARLMPGFFFVSSSFGPP